MNATIFWRILWKEYRAQRAFWISMAVLTLVVELLLLVGPWDTAVARIEAMFAMALVFPALYGLGSAATLFATERETETYDFLWALPATPLGVFAGKVAFALASTVALFGLAWTLAAAFARELPDPRFHSQIWILCGLAGAELMAWGILFSLLLKRTLVAAILAGTVMSLVLICFVFAAGHAPQTIRCRLLIVALVMLANIVLAARWYPGRWFSPAGPQNAQLSEEQIEAIFSLVLPVRSQSERTKDVTELAFGSSPSVHTMFGRLVWQELRQSAAMTAALIAMLLPMVFFLWMKWILRIDPRGDERWWFGLVPLLSTGYLSPSLLGSSVFLADQTGCRFRFLAEHGIPPRLVWLSRQIRGLVIMLLGLLLVLPPLIGLIAAQPMDLTATECALGFVVVAYACGQLCSMAFRSGIMAVTFGTILTLLICGWAAIMYWLGLCWLWTVAPLPLAFLLATWLHAPNWLSERKTWRARLLPAAVIVVPVLAILAAIPPVRVYEIPLVGPGFDVEELIKIRPIPPEEKETLALYERAFKLAQRADHTESTAEGERERQKAEAQAVTLALEASRRPLRGFSADPATKPDPAAQIPLANLVLASGKPLQAEGKLDAALDRYVAADRIAGHWLLLNDARSLEIRICEQLTRWAAQNGQKPQRVLEALRTMEEQWRSQLPYCDAIKHDYVLDRRILEGDREALRETLFGISEPRYYFTIARWLPWERARALRLLNKLTAEEIARCRGIEQALAADGAVAQLSAIVSPPLHPRDYLYDVVMGIKPYIPLDDWMRVETRRRATRLILALEAWKLEHGGLPKSLEDLKGKYLDQLPVTPYAGTRFGYEPHGLLHYATWRIPTSTATVTIDPGQPFIDCDSWPTIPDGPGSAPVLRRSEWPEGSTDAASPKTQVWRDGWVFPIP